MTDATASPTASASPAVDVTGQPITLPDIDLQRFFRPKRVAVVGASDTPGRPNTGVWKRLLAWSGEVGAEVVPVNPTRDVVDGFTCYPSLGAVDGDIDVAVLLVGDPAPVLRDAVEQGVSFAVLFAAGFAELGPEGAAKQRELGEIMAGSDLHLLGPNTNLNAFESFRTDLEGKAIALISQSGHQGRPIFQSQQLGVRLAYWAPTGNELDLEFADFAKWFADQPEVGVVAAYIEGFKNGRTVALAADHAAEQGVPIVCVKVGRTEAGASMAASHTGKLTGADAVTDAAFRQYGITRVDGLDELSDTAQLLARYPKGPADAAGEGVVVYAISGGTGAHMADLCSAAGLDLPTLSQETQDQLHEWIPDYLRVSNPVDNGGHPVGDERGRKILDRLVADPDLGVLICPITGAFPPMSDRLAQDLVDVAETTDKPICVIWGSPMGDEDAYRKILLGSSRIAVFRTFGNCVTAVKAWRDWHRFRQRRTPFRDQVALEPSPAAAVARALLKPGTTLTEHASKQVLAAYGIATTAEQVVQDADDAVAAAAAIGQGGPVVMKVSGAALAHKSEVGGVRIGVQGDDDVRTTYTELAAISGGEVLVSEQVAGGTEVVVGLAHDPLFGPVVMTGLGGVLVEVLGDVTFRVPPFDDQEAHRMLEDLRGHRIFEGVRGGAALDVDALVDVLVKLQRLAMDLGDEIAEIDINPLILRPAGQGCVALDALVVCR